MGLHFKCEEYFPLKHGQCYSRSDWPLTGQHVIATCQIHAQNLHNHVTKKEKRVTLKCHKLLSRPMILCGAAFMIFLAAC